MWANIYCWLAGFKEHPQPIEKSQQYRPIVRSSSVLSSWLTKKPVLFVEGREDCLPHGILFIRAFQITLVCAFAFLCIDCTVCNLRYIHPPPHHHLPSLICLRSRVCELCVCLPACSSLKTKSLFTEPIKISLPWSGGFWSHR